MYVNYIVLANCSYILASRSDLLFFLKKKDKSAFKIFCPGQYKLKIESKEKSILHAQPDGETEQPYSNRWSYVQQQSIDSFPSEGKEDSNKVPNCWFRLVTHTRQQNAVHTIDIERDPFGTLIMSLADDRKN